MVLVTEDIILRGAPEWLSQSAARYRGPIVNREIIICGPAGTGKSRGILQVIVGWCDAIPGMRVLVSRNSRESMTSSTLVELEECLPANHPVLSGPQREHRSIYHFDNKSEIAVIGLDKPSKIFSTKWDVIYVEEINEEGITKKTWELFRRGLRGSNMFNKQRFLIGSCNPSYPDHWVKNRLDNKLCETHSTRHEDNPRWHDGSKLNGVYTDRGWTEDGRAYIESLRQMTGHTRLRMLEGLWVAAEGLVWDCWDDRVHVVAGRVECSGPLGLRSVRIVFGGAREPVDISTVFGAVDWGYDAAGVFQVWGLDFQKRMWLLAEVYQSKKGIDWWADRCAELYREFDLHSVVADPSRPDMIEYFNRRIGLDRGETDSVPEFCVKAKNKRRGDLGGIEAVRTMMNPAQSVGSRMFFLADALRFGVDPLLVDAGHRTSTRSEVPAYVWKSRDDGKPSRDETDDACDDHGCDAMRYAVMYALDMFENPPKRQRYAPNSNAMQPRWPGKLTYEEWVESLEDQEALADVD